jgi:uncharacterized protein
MIDRAYLSINNACNLHCRYCSFRQTDLITNDEILNESDIKNILNNILNYSQKNKISVFKLGIVGAGEPFINFDSIKYIIEYVKNEDVDNILTFYTITNGTLLNSDILAFLYENKQRIMLNFSLDGYEEVHNYGKEAFYKTLEGIKKYEAVFNEKPVLNCTVSRQTIINKEEVVSFFIKNDFKKVNFNLLIDVKDQDLMITYEEFQYFLQFIKETKIIVSRQNRSERKHDCLIYGQLCGAGLNNVFITKQGIYPCCRFYKNETYKIASIDDDLFEIESNMTKMIKPVKDGECYYNLYVMKRSDI